MAPPLYSKYDKPKHLVLWNVLRKIWKGVLLVLLVSTSLLYFILPSDELSTTGEAKREQTSFRYFNDNKQVIRVIIVNYSDSERCAATVQSLYAKARNKHLIRILVHDQVKHEEISCLDLFCQANLNEFPCTVKNRTAYLTSQRLDAYDSRGFSNALALAENLLANDALDDDFCLSIDSRMVFESDWDRKMKSDWSLATQSLQSSGGAIITTAPKSAAVYFDGTFAPSTLSMCTAQMNDSSPNRLVRFNAPNEIKGSSPTTPRLQSQFSEKFHFSTCDALQKVPADPYLWYLDEGYEYTRAVRFWTRGYDFFSPTNDYVYQYYEPRIDVTSQVFKTLSTADQQERLERKAESQRRARELLTLPTFGAKSSEVIFERSKYQIGRKRSMRQYQKFSRINPLAPYNVATNHHFINCDIDLQRIPIRNDV